MFFVASPADLPANHHVSLHQILLASDSMAVSFASCTSPYSKELKTVLTKEKSLSVSETVNSKDRLAREEAKSGFF